MSRQIEFLQHKAKNIRLDILEMIYNAKSGHLGGSLSMVEALVALYFDVMNYDPKDPERIDRDRFVLSKGHTAPALYATLAAAGFFPREWLMTSFRGINSKLQGHPDMKKTPGIEMTTGSLGIGLSAANGMALASKIKNIPYKVYCMIGDGETNEGQIWEAAATASHYKLNNVIAFIDENRLQNDAQTLEVKDMDSQINKWESFGWHTQQIDGHDYLQIFGAIDYANICTDRPSLIVLRTIKGKGVTFMENAVEWHGKTPSKEEYERAKAELS